MDLKEIVMGMFSGPVRVTEEEMRRIADSSVENPLVGIGFLEILRAHPELTPDELLEAALGQLHNEEHHPAMRQARDFFTEHAAEFGLKVEL